jgi:fluoroacetyl-CoA thioesterase
LTPSIIRHKFNIGDKKHITHTVRREDIAEFSTGVVHPFYATFALGRDAEWACRQFVLEMKEEDEEGIGTFLNIEHKSPAMLGETVDITAVISSLDGHSIVCNYEAKVGDRLIAVGTAGQKILKKEKVERLIRSITGG